MLSESLQRLIYRCFLIRKRRSDLHIRHSQNVYTFVKHSNACLCDVKRFVDAFALAVMLIEQSKRYGLGLLKLAAYVLEFKFFSQLALFKSRAQRFKPFFVISHDSQSSVAYRGSV